MTLVPKSNQRVVVALMAISLLSGVLAFKYVSIPESAQPSAGEKLKWQAPALPQPENLQAISARLEKLHLWGRKKDADAIAEEEEKKKQQIVWHFVGLTYEGEKRYMLLMDEANKISRHEEGAPLPNDVVLHAIGEDSIEIKKEEKVETLHLYDQVTYAKP
ncbi:MAG: hypothetical protein GY862_19020 [Gammaproteobacteria bacterium]|nr:hypothetical protein [Gammaproteobacteria bacterium]